MFYIVVPLLPNSSMYQKLFHKITPLSSSSHGITCAVSYIFRDLSHKSGASILHGNPNLFFTLLMALCAVFIFSWRFLVIALEVDYSFVVSGGLVGVVPFTDFIQLCTLESELQCCSLKISWCHW
jgi:hypothetical protein